MSVRWKRREAGSYLATIDGIRITICNMKGNGPNAPRWQGPVAAWAIRLGGEGDYDIGARTIHHAWTLADAKQWVIARYGAGEG